MVSRKLPPPTPGPESGTLNMDPETYAQTSLATIGAIMIPERTDDFVVLISS